MLNYIVYVGLKDIPESEYENRMQEAKTVFASTRNLTRGQRVKYVKSPNSPIIDIVAVPDSSIRKAPHSLEQMRNG